MKQAQAEYRKKYGIREATPEELASMSDLQRIHYNDYGKVPWEAELGEVQKRGILGIILCKNGRITTVGFPGTRGPSVQAHLKPWRPEGQSK